MKKKTIVEDIHGNQFEMEVEETRILTETEVKEHIKNTPKIDVEALLAQGCMEANEFFNRLENGNI